MPSIAKRHKEKSVSLATDMILASYRVTVDYSLTLEQMLERERYHCPHPFITTANFPLKEKNEGEVEILLFQPRTRIDTEKIIEEMDSLGFRPATVRELVSIGKKLHENHPELTINALGECQCNPTGDICVVCVNRDNDDIDHDLGLSPLSVRFDGPRVWNKYHCFAVVTKQPYLRA